MARMAQNEMKAMRDMPWRVRSTEGLGDCGKRVALLFLGREFIDNGHQQGTAAGAQQDDRNCDCTPKGG